MKKISQKQLDHKIVWSDNVLINTLDQNKCCSEEVLIETFFDQKSVDQKIFWSKKYYDRKIIRSNNISTENSFEQKTRLIKKSFGQREIKRILFDRKNILIKKHVDQQIV